LFESIARDNQQPQDIRLMCAGVLIRDEQPAEPQLTPEERRRRIDELLRKRDGGPTLIGTATDEPSASTEPVPQLSAPPAELSHNSRHERDDREATLAKAERMLRDGDLTPEQRIEVRAIHRRHNR
jgi:hypothetical protein